MGLLGPIGAIAGTLLNNLSINKQNRRSENFSREMYDRQFTDNVNFWKQQNEYNDPSSQMARLQKAGLNPAMMYGGSGGAASSGQAGSIQTPDIQRPEFRPQDFGQIPQQIGAYADIGIKKAQTNLLRTQNTNATLESIGKALQNKHLNFDFWQKRRLKDWSFDAVRENVRLMNMQMQNIRSRNIVDDQGRNLETLLKNDMSRKGIALREYELKLNKIGLQKNDPAWQRLMYMFFKNPKKAAQTIKDLNNYR